MWHKSSFNTRLCLYLAIYRLCSQFSCLPVDVFLWLVIRTVRLWQLGICTNSLLPVAKNCPSPSAATKFSFRINAAAYSGLVQCQLWKDGAAVTYWVSWASLVLLQWHLVSLVSMEMHHLVSMEIAMVSGNAPTLGFLQGEFLLENSDQSEPYFKQSIIFTTYNPHRWDCNIQKVVAWFVLHADIAVFFGSRMDWTLGFCFSQWQVI